MAFSADGFDNAVPRPPGLFIAHIQRAIDFIEERAEEWLDLYSEQANIFSAVIGILGVRALDSLSPYKRNKHPDIAQQRFPDLSLKGRPNPPPSEALESKGSTRSWAIQSHYNHPGWYIVWRYAIDPTKQMKRGKPVLIWRVDVPFLEKEDWKYEGSKAAEGAGGRTHTFGVKNPGKRISGAIVYQAPNVRLYRGKPCLADSAPPKRI
ncbi:MAG TPA: hypothetical protein VMG40_00640 [Bryobacteraceae bacterium]|nr:hypothetical protein [Bryobacteraceae bacterium]